MRIKNNLLINFLNICRGKIRNKNQSINMSPLKRNQRTHKTIFLQNNNEQGFWNQSQNIQLKKNYWGNKSNFFPALCENLMSDYYNVKCFMIRTKWRIKWEGVFYLLHQRLLVGFLILFTMLFSNSHSHHLSWSY